MMTLILGLLLGAVPFYFGNKENQIKIGAYGLIASLLSMFLFGFFFSLIVAAGFTAYIKRKELLVYLNKKF